MRLSLWTYGGSLTVAWRSLVVPPRLVTCAHVGSSFLAVFIRP
jgi:hypothetical protein